ncbi:MAG: hypothetical protein HZB67_04800 [Candidatus Aenigmarchaeota archaeon]|nr:hypothetical protein [Candidatus Aenigmarchaeota archaeon]
MSKKGITPVISIVLLLLIVIVLVALAFLFFGNIFTISSKESQESLENTIAQTKAMFTIDNIDTSNATVFIRNTGSVPITNLTVYLNGQRIGANFSRIELKSIGAMGLESQFPDGKNKIKIVTTGLFYQEETFYVQNTFLLEDFAFTYS